MADTREIIKKKITYTGPFSVQDLHKMLKEWAGDYSYEAFETEHKEKVTESGKNITYKFKHEKKVSDYAKFVIEIENKMKNVENIVLEIDGKDRKLYKGDVEIEIKGILETDRLSKWEERPGRLFLRGIYDKFLFGSTVSGWEKTLKQEVAHLKQEVEAHLNLFKMR